MQKAYPGLLEPGYSYNITSFASNRTQTIKPSKGRRPLCTFLLSAQSLLLQTQQQLQHCVLSSPVTVQLSLLQQGFKE